MTHVLGWTMTTWLYESFLQPSRADITCVREGLELLSLRVELLTRGAFNVNALLKRRKVYEMCTH